MSWQPSEERRFACLQEAVKQGGITAEEVLRTAQAFLEYVEKGTVPKEVEISPL